MTTTLQQQGRRLYFRGAPYSSKDTLKAAGARWDPEERCWWMGTSKRTVAEELVTQINNSSSTTSVANRGLERHSKTVIGRASHKGQSCLLLYAGPTRRGGEAAKLATRGGSRVWWAPLEEVTIVKRYRQPRSIKELDAYAQAYRDNPDGPPRYRGGSLECWECGATYNKPGYVESGNMGCVRCS